VGPQFKEAMETLNENRVKAKKTKEELDKKVDIRR
jgi:hypothetical protein